MRSGISGSTAVLYVLRFDFIRFDVAVLRLDRPVHYMPHIAPICLPEKNEDFLGEYGWAAGWGALQAGTRILHIKNVIKL